MLAMRSISVIISIISIMLLAGCATLQNSLNQKEIANLRIDRVKVSFEPNAAVLWPKVEQAYVASLPPDKNARKFGPADLGVSGGGDEQDSEYAAKAATPEAKAHLRERLVAMIKSRLQRDVLGAFQGGARAAELRVRVRSFAIPSPIQRVLVGGQPALVATTTLHDAKTGKKLALMKATAAGYAGGGLIGVAVDQAFSDLDDRVMSRYVRDVHNWLQKRQ